MNRNTLFVLHLVGNIPGILEHIIRQFGGTPVYHQYNSDLLVFVADIERGPLFTDISLEPYRVDFQTAFSEARENTLRLLFSEDIGVINGDVFGSFECAGFWRSHLLLATQFWDNPLFRANEELIIGIPTRDELLFFDSSNLERLPLFQHEVGLRYEQGPHRLSGRLFVRRNGLFVPYKFELGPKEDCRKWWQFW